MRRRALSRLILATLLAGCGGRPPSSANTAGVGPHRGRLVKLPDDLGFAEVVVEYAGNPARSMTIEVAAYFLGPDSRAPLNPPPTDVSLSLYLAESKTREQVALRAGEAGRYAAAPPPGFDGNIASGKLNAKLAGRDVGVSF